MVFEVCALVATIIFGVIGVELMLWIRSARKLTDEAKQTVQDINAHLPYLLSDVQAVTSVVRQTSEQVGGTVNEVAVSLEEMRKNPLRFIAVFLEGIKQLMALWQDIRGRKKEASDS
ncbi:hypothetical protein [Desulfosporosinus lacus]|uniref:DUF948 domain-containing protein n=1 Tax=Desulfosporosinus lacus DSM 15449 TaxID=1121420 RepID=A0A1M5RZS6_9FIRM|nr:hypothetical protein [Desulfosporosinus lacus]SHH31716.1 hypothetical protein SAMN02746098_00707 [Desulfosporosinus lacus DSM 15449]